MLNREQQDAVRQLWEKYGPLASGRIAKELGLTKEYVDTYVRGLNGGSIGLEAGAV